MNNLRVITTEERLINVYSSQMFRSSPIIASLCRELISLGPVFMADESDPVERGHFGTYFGVILDRPGFYECQPTIRDLYLVHEMMHWYSMTYAPGTSWTWHAWFRKMLRSEDMASLFSEAFIYFWMPQLRRFSFPHEIWADRFLMGPPSPDGREWDWKEWFTDLKAGKAHEEMIRYDVPPMLDFQEDRHATLPLTSFAGALTLPRMVQEHMSAIAAERKRVKDMPSSYDFLELQIHSYRDSNVAWCRAWADCYREVENHMSDLRRQCQRGVSEAAISDHIEWLNSHMDDSVVFRGEAERFAQIYKTTKTLYGNDILTK